MEGKAPRKSMDTKQRIIYALAAVLCIGALALLAVLVAAVNAALGAL